MLGTLLHDTGRPEEAVVHLRRAVDLGHPQARAALGLVLHELGRSTEAEQQLRRAVGE